MATRTKVKQRRLNSKTKMALQEALSEGRFSGICMCGCGEATPIAPQTAFRPDNTVRQVQGYPRDYVNSTHALLDRDPSIYENVGGTKGVLRFETEQALEQALADGKFSGICGCGCGQKTEIAEVTRYSRDGRLLSVMGYPREMVGWHNYKGEDSPRFKGTGTNKGYKTVYMPDHPRAYRKYVREHILLMEEKLGRPLRHISFNHGDNEIVHHVDGDKLNNDLGNLELMTHREHTRMHSTKLTATDVSAARERIRAGDKAYTVAEDLGIHRATLSAYLNGHRTVN